MSNAKTRELLRAIRNKDDEKARGTLRDILKEKVLKRLRETTKEV